MANENGGNGRKDATPAYPEDEDDQSARETVTGLLSPDRSEAEEADKNGEEEQIHKSRSPKRRKIPLEELLKNKNGGNGRKDATPAYPEDEDDQSAHKTVTGLSSPDRSEAEEADKNGEEEQIHKSRSPKKRKIPLELELLIVKKATKQKIKYCRKSTVRRTLASSSWDAAYPTYHTDRAIRPTSPTPATIEIPENRDANGHHSTNSTIVESQEKLGDDNAKVGCFCFRK